MNSISDLTTFVEIVRAGSFVAAAKKLGVTPSGVSKKISRFEQRLGTRLFNRTTRSISLTDAGDLLFSRGSNILDYVDEAESLLKDLSSRPRGTLRIAASDAFAKEVLVPFLTLFSNKYQDLHIDIVPGDGEIDLLDNRIDVAIRFDQPNTESFVSRKLIDDPWVICASPCYLEAHGTPWTPNDLHQHQCLLIRSPSRSSKRWQFRTSETTENNSTRYEIEISPTLSGIGLVVKEAAIMGMGVARLARFLVHAELDKKTLVPLLTDFAVDNQRAIYFVYPNRQYLPLKVRLFIDELHNFYNDLHQPVDNKPN
jgi:DNA-binding transcriptional LysR family regulator